MSYLPIAVDATASALQHWSAALHDEEGARRVNLIDGPRRDVYIETLDVLTEHLREADHPMASFLLSSPYLDRNLVKTPQMARTYGGTKRGVEDHVRRFCSHIDSMRALKSAELPVADFCREVGGFIWDAINASLTGAKAGMDYAMQVAKVANLMGLPLSWEVPTGFLVQTAYWSTRERRIRTHLLGDIYTPTIREHTQRLDKRQQVSSIAPNLIHSMDAAALMKAVNACVELGVTDVMTIHDSFSVHAKNVDKLNTVLRSTFADLYRGNFLAEWTESALPTSIRWGMNTRVEKALAELEPPPQGSLDLDQILKSTYAFS